MYTIDKRDTLRELADIPFPPSELPEPLLLADEDTLVVSYLVGPPSTAQAVGASASPLQAPAALVVFRDCFATHFGTPNDEAFASHPLADRGLRPYRAFEVEGSSWLRDLEMRNRGHPRHDPQLFQQLRHWVLTFRASVLECAALTYATAEVHGSPDDLLLRMRTQLRPS